MLESGSFPNLMVSKTEVSDEGSDNDLEFGDNVSSSAKNARDVNVEYIDDNNVSSGFVGGLHPTNSMLSQS